MCRVSNLRGNWSYIKPIMDSCPIKTPEHVVQEATAWTWHSIYSKISRQHLCKANWNCSPGRLGGRGLGYPTPHWPHARNLPVGSDVLVPASNVWTVPSLVRLKLFWQNALRLLYLPQYAFMLCAQQSDVVLYVHYLHVETVLSRHTLKWHHWLISFPVRWSQHD